MTRNQTPLSKLKERLRDRLQEWRDDGRRLLSDTSAWAVGEQRASDGPSDPDDEPAPPPAGPTDSSPQTERAAAPPESTPAVDDAVDDAADATDASTADRVPHGKPFLVDLLDANDGRLWQREIVERSEASSSTVSRWLCDLEEDGRIERVRLGREKIVTLPDATFDLAEAPPTADERTARGQD